jgi:hypothetical protein
MIEGLKFNKNKNNVYIKENNNNLLIIPDCFFMVSGIFSVESTKKKILTFYINQNNENHKEFMNIIRNIYDECSEFLEKDEELNPDIISNPMYKKNDSTYTFSVNIANWEGNLITKFYDVENDQVINLQDFENKSFSIYPAIHIEKMYISTKNNVCYIECMLKEAYIKINQNKKLLDYKKAKDAVNK